MGKEIVNLYGPGYITDYIGNVCYRISPLSFYQVNPVQTQKLYGTALEYAGLTGEETVWDLYCGIGTISLFLAQKAKKVYGVEIVPQAIDDARANAELNHFENVQFFVGKAEEVLPEQYEKNQVYADTIVVDPPRKGCDSVCLDTIVKMAPKKVVYVSCDSATLARDVKYLGERGYQVERVRTVDMFPWSGHVETVCLLSKLHEAKHHVNVTVDMDEMDLTLDMNLRLVKASEEYRSQISYMMEEWNGFGEKIVPYAIRRLDYRDFENYCNNLEIKDGSSSLVPDSTFFCFDEDRNIMVGAVNIRHYLNESLLRNGGHIGDGVRPSERRKGIATKMIALALDECRKLGIEKVLMVCDKENIGSAKSIINNGGVLENEVEVDGVIEQRYWIDLTKVGEEG